MTAVFQRRMLIEQAGYRAERSVPQSGQIELCGESSSGIQYDGWKEINQAGISVLLNPLAWSRFEINFNSSRYGRSSGSLISQTSPILESTCKTHQPISV